AFPALSADGRLVAFESDASNLVPGINTGNSDIYVRDRKTGKTERVSNGPGGVRSNDDSFGPAISDDGRFVAFPSLATNLVPGNHTDAFLDVFVHDRKTGKTQQVSVGPGGAQGNGDSTFTGAVISTKGRFVAFQSDATNLVP